MQEKVLKKCQETVELLKEKGLKIATAESCTGGMVSQFITSVSGASAVYEMGICSYSSTIKNKILGVKSETLEKFGAVSGETATEMAENARRMSGADVAVSVTGAAGPDSCEGHPAGYVFIALSTKEKTTVRLLEIEPISRDYIRLSATYEIFKLINETLGK